MKFKQLKLNIFAELELEMDLKNFKRENSQT